MTAEPTKIKKKSFLADLFGEMPSLDDLEKTSTETKQDHQGCSIESAKKPLACSPPLAIKTESGSASNSEIDHNSLQNSKPSVSIDDLLNYINVSNEERRDASHVTPPYSPPSHGLGDFEKKKIKEKKTKKNRRKRMAKQATIKHNDRPLESVDDMEFDSLLDSYTQVQQKGKRKHSEVEHKDPEDIMDVAAEILGRPVKRVMEKHPQQKHQQQQQHQRQHQQHQQSVKQENKMHNTQKKSHGDKSSTANQNKSSVKKEWVPEKECVFWKSGHCKDGDKCTFKHQGEQIKKLCQFIQSQSCQKGADCEFSHDLKSEPCRFYFVDTCKSENECPYYHGELTENMKTKLHRMTGYCRFFHFKGYCNSGDKCPFSHEPITDQEELTKLEGSITPCKYFKLGKCKAGNECFYNH